MSEEERLEEIVQACLQRLDAGETIQACLRDYPDHAHALAPLLEAGADLRRWQPPALPDTPHYAARARARAALRARHAQRQSARDDRAAFLAARRAAPLLLTLILFLGLLGGFSASERSVPG